MQINPRHPPWYNMYAARLLFSLGRYESRCCSLAAITDPGAPRPPRRLPNCCLRLPERFEEAGGSFLTTTCNCAIFGTAPVSRP